MFNQITNQLARIPTPMGGLALGIASLGMLWESVSPQAGLIQSSSATISGLLLMVMLARFILHPKSLWDDLCHPVAGSVVPTFAMATLVVSASVAALSTMLATVLWLAALSLHMIFLGIFLIQRLKHFRFDHLLPSWFIPPIGMVVAVLTRPDLPALLPVCYAALILGVVNYALLLPMMLNRLIFCDKVSDAAKPTIAVLAAPASLCLAGYLSLVAEPSPVVVAILLGIALLMTFVIYLALIHLLRLPFAPGFAAFTFPLVISATALFKTHDWMQSIGIEPHYLQPLQRLAYVELFIATAVVLYVCIAYLRAWAQSGTQPQAAIPV